jgi:hypothetical protein
MGVVWPSAGRALALFTGAKTGVADNSMVELTQSSTTKEKTKRVAEEDLDDSPTRRYGSQYCCPSAAWPRTAVRSQTTY